MPPSAPRRRPIHGPGAFGYGLVQAAAAVKAAAPIVIKTQQFVTCQRSLAIPCVSIGITCTVRVFCQPSRATVCPSRTFLCQQSAVDACPSVRISCPSELVLCQATIGGPGCTPVSLADCPSLPCPNSLACGSFGCRPGRLGAGPADAQWENYDPYGYDPYGTQYEE